MKDENQALRLANINSFIKVIGDHGRQFFFDKKTGDYAYMELDERGRVWFIDDYSKKRIYTHYPHRWKGFSHGGTLKSLVGVFKEHIKRGVQINPGYFESTGYCSNQHPWGYPGEELTALHNEGVRLGIVKTRPGVQNG